NRRNRSCNYASLSHPLNQSGDSYPSSPNHIRPHLKFSIWDRGTLRVPFLSDDQRLMGEGKDKREHVWGGRGKKEVGGSLSTRSSRTKNNYGQALSDNRYE
ncbi:hypothetical protein TNCV_1724141, partial [Trichonephila clavipes]